MLHLLDQVSTNTNNKIEVIEIECNLIRWIDKNTLKDQWRPLEEVLDKVGFRNKLKEVRVKLSVGTNGKSDRGKIAVAVMVLFPSLRERGVIISVQDEGQTWRNDQFVSASLLSTSIYGNVGDIVVKVGQ